MAPGPISGTSTSTPTLSPAQILLERAHSPTSASRIFADRIQSKPLLLQPTVHTDKRALRRHIRERKKRYHLRKQARRGNKPLSAKEKRRLGVYRLKKEEVKGEGTSEVYQGLNQLWNGYMLEVLGYMKQGVMVEGWEKKEVNVVAQGSLLASADLHGAWVEVVRSRDAGRVGVKGVVGRETKFQVTVVGNGGRWWVVPKSGCVFAVTVQLPRVEGGRGEDGEGRKIVFEIQGKLFEYRPVERANRKFKWRAMDDV